MSNNKNDKYSEVWEKSEHPSYMHCHGKVEINGVCLDHLVLFCKIWFMNKLIKLSIRCSIV